MHELTKRIEMFMEFGHPQADKWGNINNIITAYMKEKAEWLKGNIKAADKYMVKDCEEIYPDLIDTAFGLKEKTLKEKFAEVDIGYYPAKGGKTLLCTKSIDELARIAEDHSKTNRA